MCSRRTLLFPAAVIVVFICLVQIIQASNPRVNTTSGEAVGLVKTVPVGRQTVDVNVFLGIPYAEPPTGDRRFRRTVTKEKTDEYINATDYGFVCPQNTAWFNLFKPRFPPSAFVVNEDCLVLNIYAPSNVSKGDQKSTMVWIHGGSYNSGTANMYDGSLLAAYGDVVVVVINYRLGALGYLSTGDSFSKGNYGTYDQQMALSWVVHNIGNFGGSSSNITLFGESAGGTSVSLLPFNHPTNILFKRIIAESGAALTHWSVVKYPAEKTKTFASYSNCPNASKELIDCLRGVSVDEIIKYQTQMDIAKGTYGELNFGPVVDGDFLQLSPQDIAAGKGPKESTKRFAEIDHLIGTNSQEGAMIYQLRIAPYMEQLHFNDSVVGLPEAVFRDMLNKIALDICPEHSAKLLPLLEYRYTDHTRPDDGMLRAIKFIDLLTDREFYAGIVAAAQFHARAANSSENDATGNTFFYLFDQRGTWSSHEPWRNGADHADDLSFVFGFPLISPDSLQEEKQLSITMMKLWSNFAKTGDPNLPVDPEYRTTWPKYKLGDEKYMVLSLEKNPDKLIRTKLAADRVALWNDLVPRFLALFKQVEACPFVENDKTCTGTAIATVSFSMSVTILFSLLRMVV